MKILLFLLMSSSVWASEAIYQTALWEEQGGVVREHSKKMRMDASFTASLKIEGFPPLKIRKKLLQEEEKGHLLHLQYELRMAAKEEVIPLSDEEMEINEKLRAFQMQEVDLKGEWEVWIDSKEDRTVAEKYFLEGFVVRHNKKEDWKWHWARGIAW